MIRCRTGTAVRRCLFSSLVVAGATAFAAGDEWVYDTSGWITETKSSQEAQLAGELPFDTSVSAASASDGSSGVDSVVFDFGVSNETKLNSNPPSGIMILIR